MEVTYLGHSSFKIKGKNTSVVTDPFDEKMVGLKFPKVEGDIVTISHHHADHDKVSNVENVKKVIDGPGEYEIAGVSVIGIRTYHDDKKGEERGKNTIYIIEVDGLRLLHLGDLGHKLDESQVKEIGTIDILFIPIGGVYTIDPDVAVEVMKQIGASIVIPMHYKEDAILNDFLNQSGLRVEKLPKLTVKVGDINTDEEYALVLEKK